LRSDASPGPTAGRGGSPAVGVLVLIALLSGCTGASASGTTPPWASEPPPIESTAPSGVPPVKIGKPGRTQRVHFVPELLILPDDARAGVHPAATVDGQLKVPEDVEHVGWWDGSAYAGDPFGSTVIAGHVDSATDGIGFFNRLKRIKRGDVVTLRAGPRRLSYRISSVETVDRQALATDSRAFDQTGAHRLVLITCTGDFRRDRGGYESNLVVTGQPIGLAR
jgi:LPXTG-site transpeptidase (sortase) family protein